MTSYTRSFPLDACRDAMRRWPLKPAAAVLREDGPARQGTTPLTGRAAPSGHRESRRSHVVAVAHVPGLPGSRSSLPRFRWAFRLDVPLRRTVCPSRIFARSAATHMSKRLSLRFRGRVTSRPPIGRVPHREPSPTRLRRPGRRPGRGRSSDSSRASRLGAASDVGSPDRTASGPSPPPPPLGMLNHAWERVRSHSLSQRVSRLSNDSRLYSVYGPAPSGKPLVYPGWGGWVGCFG